MFAFIKNVNLAVAFLLELCLLAAFCYWGFSTNWGIIARIGIGIGVPVLVAIIWGCFEAPRAAWPLPEPWHLLVKLALFGLGSAALCAAGRWKLGLSFTVIFLISMALAYAWGQEHGAHTVYGKNA